MSINGSLSGISFTGLASGIDSQNIVSQLMQIEALPLQRMQRQQTILANKQSLFAQLKSNLVSFNSAASALNTAASFNPITATSSDSAVATVTATSSAIAGTYELTVSKLATSHKVASSAQANVTTSLGYSGSFVVNGRAVTVDSSDTLSSIAGKINSVGAGVTASVIDGGTGNARLTLTSSSSGAAKKIQLASLTGTALSSLGMLTGAASFRDAVDADSVRSYEFSSPSTALSSLLGSSASGSFDIGNATIAIDFATDSLESIASKINGDVNSNATATVVSVTADGKTTHKLEITGNGGSLPTITDTSGLLESIGVLQRANSNQLVAAQDAAYTLDGFSFTSATNSVSNVIPGATFTLLNADVATPKTATLTFSKDSQKVKESFDGLVTAYNSVVSFIKQTTSFDSETFSSGPLFGESSVTQVESMLSGILFRDAGSGTYKNLAQIGFGFDTEGNLKLDGARLEQALSNDPESVRRLMMAVGDSSSNDLAYITSTSATKNSSPTGYEVNVTQLATKGINLATFAQASVNTAGETLTFNGGLFNNTDYVLTVPIGASQSTLVNLINNDERLKDIITASVDGSGFLKLESKRWGADGNFSAVSNLAAAADNSGLGTTGGTVTAGVNIAGTIGGLAATGNGQYLTGDNGTDVAGLQIQYKGVGTGIVGSINFQRGVAALLSDTANSFTDSVNGLLATTDSTLQSQIDDISERMTSFQARLELRRGFLQQKFLAMERAVTSLQGQQAQLSAMLTQNAR